MDTWEDHAFQSAAAQDLVHEILDHTHRLDGRRGVHRSPEDELALDAGAHLLALGAVVRVARNEDVAAAAALAEIAGEDELDLDWLLSQFSEADLHRLRELISLTLREPVGLAPVFPGQGAGRIEQGPRPVSAPTSLTPAPAPAVSPASTASAPPAPASAASPPAAPAPAAPLPRPPHRHEGRAGLLQVTGHEQPSLDGTPMTTRHAEILTLLAWHTQGLSGAELEAALYAEETDCARRAISLRAEVHRLRKALHRSGSAVQVLSRPYRLSEHVHADVVCARTALQEGDLDRALHAATGPVLPRSESPGVEAIREEIFAGLREAVAADAGADQLWAYLTRPEAHDDRDLWTLALRILPADSPRRAFAVATLERIDRDLG
ncbi:helix-turn-helix domain-containing protein [Micrococcus sp.]|uniref:helix-turn-helix domain-containing protein n=1 Tax=Micrococcus sp. TaxID=1271 RepID=UPI002A90B4E1|nr:helix-turn-helix domain-containing protein [Micrococcus sp.]MDY6054998.1 helix-turn-helix domain-containing protein [Micrococcus sp.]